MRYKLTESAQLPTKQAYFPSPPRGGGKICSTPQLSVNDIGGEHRSVHKVSQLPISSGSVCLKTDKR
ncbi:MAG: hypothetical protein DDT37_01116 [Firmicutes bacterium]|nr:hypothetical protein [candidate division NPL-UPA2 bacterium]